MTSGESLPLAVLVVQILALLFHLISFGSPFWYTAPNGHSGLWAWCTYYPSRCYHDLRTHPAWEIATAVFMSISLLFLFGAAAIALLYYCKESFATKGRMKTTVYFSFGTAAASLLGLIIWGAKVGQVSWFQLGWAYALAVIQCILRIVGGVMALVIVSRNTENTSDAERPPPYNPGTSEYRSQIQPSVPRMVPQYNHGVPQNDSEVPPLYTREQYPTHFLNYPSFEPPINIINIGEMSGNSPRQSDAARSSEDQNVSFENVPEGVNLCVQHGEESGRDTSLTGRTDVLIQDGAKQAGRQNMKIKFAKN